MQNNLRFCSNDEIFFGFRLRQVRIRIECAFGMMVHCWGILRMAMPKGLGIVRIIAMVNARKSATAGTAVRPHYYSS